MNAEEIAKHLVSGELSVMIGAGLAIALWAWRSRKKLAEIDTGKEVMAILVPVGMLAATAMAGGADWWEVGVGALTQLLIALGFNSPVVLPVKEDG